MNGKLVMRLVVTGLVAILVVSARVSDVAAQFSQDDLDAAREAGRHVGSFVGQNVVLILVGLVIVYLVRRPRRRK